MQCLIRYEFLGESLEFHLKHVLKKEMCGIVPKSPEELFANPLLKRNVHIISVQMLLILLKKFVRFGNYETICDTQYEIVQEDYKKIIQLQLVVAEQLNQKHSEEFDKSHFFIQRII